MLPLNNHSVVHSVSFLIVVKMCEILLLTEFNDKPLQYFCVYFWSKIVVWKLIPSSIIILRGSEVSILWCIGSVYSPIVAQKFDLSLIKRRIFGSTKEIKIMRSLKKKLKKKLGLQYFGIGRKFYARREICN